MEKGHRRVGGLDRHQQPDVSTKIAGRKRWLGTGAAIALGLIFVAAGLGKSLDQPEAFKVFFVPFSGFISPAFTKVVFIWLPRIELIVGSLLIVGILGKLSACVAAVIIAGFITNNSLRLVQGLGSESCGCFGPLAALSVLDSLYLDIGMLALVAVVLLCSGGNFFNISPWFRGKNR